MYCERNGNSKDWQMPAYEFARQVAEQHGITTIVDIGCGHAEKLVSVFPGYDLIGIDTGENIDFCKERHIGEWIDQDLNLSLELPELKERSLIICADVIEHLVNPGVLLNCLARLNREGHEVVVTTPERVKTYGVDHNGPPLNESHVREWTITEFNDLLRQYGLNASTRLIGAKTGESNPTSILATTQKENANGKVCSPVS